MTTFNNIPLEMRQYPQWVLWRYEETDGGKPTKVPYSAVAPGHASVVNPNTWATFDDTVKAFYTSGNYSGIGFVFAANDPFCGIDLDDTDGDELALERQKKIHDTFNTYSEYSPSGRGVHLICRGHVPAGRKRSKVEIYSAGRFFTMTGNVLNAAPIADRQGFVEILWNELGATVETYYVEGELEEKETDDVIINRAMNARNGDKFNQLWRGEWKVAINERTGQPFASQSEADQALVNIIAYHTRNRNQIRNLFLKSGLGQRDKAKRIPYVEAMINKSFDRLVPMIDFDGLRNAIETQIAEKEAARSQPPAEVTEGNRAAPISGPSADFPPIAYPTPKSNKRQAHNPPPLPPGLVGLLARFFYQASPRPVPDIALMGALGFMAGVCGRTYNISGTGLNQYFLLLAKTGRGKESMSSGIDKIVASFKETIPAIHQFIGPGDIASGQALIKHLGVSPSFVSIIGEFDKLLSAMSHQRANSAMIMLRKVILDLFGKSGSNQTYRPLIYSDSKQNTNTVVAPAFSLLGECTPEKFYELLDENLISEGLLPRFMIIEYLGNRPPLNRNHTSVMPDPQLLKMVESVIIGSLTMIKNNVTIAVQADPEAQRMLDEFNDFCDDQINDALHDVVSQLWNRAHLKVLKISGLVAVGCNPHYPTITKEIVRWSIDLVERDVRNLLSRFQAGEIGSDEAKQMYEIRRVIAEYMTEDYERVGKYGVSRAIHNAKVVPLRYIQHKLSAMSCFRKDRLGPTFSIKRAIGILLDQSEIIEINRDQLQKEFGSSGRSFMIKEMKI